MLEGIPAEGKTDSTTSRVSKAVGVSSAATRIRLPTQDWIARQTLSVRFLLASGLLILITATIAGHLIAGILVSNATNSRAASTALLVQRMIQPIAQELEVTTQLSSTAVAELDRLFAAPEVRQRFPYLEVWLPDGTVAYSLSKELVGKRFNAPEGMKRALAGEVAAQHADLEAGEHTQRNFTTPYLEIYSPIHDKDTGAVFAVAEIHEDATVVGDHLLQLQFQSWGIVAATSALVMLGLFGIVHRASMTIERQRKLLNRRAEEAERARDEVQELRKRDREASVRLASMNENFARGIGADLHDGPGQLLSYALLQLEPVRVAKNRGERDDALHTVSSTLSEALAEIRTIARSLLLPDIERLDLDQIVARVIRNHEARTGSRVLFEPCRANPELPVAIKTCIYRFLQEGLNNAHRHAGANGQKVECALVDGKLMLAVCDDGLKPGEQSTARHIGGMGIQGLRQRVESLGGALTFASRTPKGTRLEMTIDMEH
ncbi:sensor histidine kinase [Rhizobium grahamii]|uniref:histidine kinase n=1 Tax=Rhizobium grahamii CCGE 502 TaxID=990285 RepID=S3HLH1_9HYPH|nr:histidine kinase [Rhizobium grahamii]EPE98935.1 two-component sensor histidine kinase [Rhizobium grahamii CCGE 502]